MSMCFAFGCNHRALHDVCKFFRFPKEPKAFKVWRNMCRRSDSEPKRHHRLCSCHFVDGNKANGPTIFPRNEKTYFLFTSPEKRRRRGRKTTTLPPSSSGEPHPEDGTSQAQDFVGGPWLEENSEPSTVELPSVEYLLNALAEVEKVNAQLKTDLLAAQSELNLKTASLLTTPGNVLTYASLAADVNAFHYYTGLPDFGAFEVLLKILSYGPLQYYDGWKPMKSLEDQLLLTLVKLRINSDYTDLSNRFKISRQAVRNIFLTIAYALHTTLFPFLTMPSRAKNKKILSPAFKNFPNCRCIIDCTEIVCAVPRNSLEKQSQTYSHYKHRNTFKALVACSPHGAVTFISKLFPGSVSDKAIVEESGIVNNFEAGDLILADKGFLIRELLPPGVSVNVPPFLTNQQFTETEAKITTEIARARIEIERVIGRLKTYNILDFVPVCLREHADMIFQLVGCLINLHHPLSSPMTSCIKVD